MPKNGQKERVDIKIKNPEDSQVSKVGHDNVNV